MGDFEVVCECNPEVDITVTELSQATNTDSTAEKNKNIRSV